MNELNHKQFLERVIKLMPLASQDETRSHLCGVRLSARIEADGNNVYTLDACDGHKLSREEFTLCEDLGMLKGESYLIEKHHVSIIKAALKEFKFHAVCEFSGNSMCINKNLSIELNAATNYPKVEQLIPKKNQTVTIAFNAEYMLQISKALREGNRTCNVYVSFTPNSEGKCIEPFIVTDSITKREAVLMPVRVN